MKTLKFLAIASIAAALVYSCQPKEEVKPSSSAAPNAPAADKPIVAKETSKASVEASSATMMSAGAKVADSKVTKTLSSLSNIAGVGSMDVSPSRISPKTNLGLEVYKLLKIAAINRKFRGAKIEDPELASLAYEFAFDFQKNRLDTVRKSDKIIISFPDSANYAKGVNGGVNNCKFTLSDLEFYKYSEYNDEYPTLVNMELTVDNQKLMAFNFNTTYVMIESSETPVPSNSKTVLLFYPMQLSQESSSDYKTTVSTASTLEDLEAGQKLVGYKFSASGADILKEDIDKIEGFAFVGDLAFEGKVNVKPLNINSTNPPSQELIDANVDFKFKSYKNGDLFAKVKYDVSKGEFFVIYKDNSSEKLSDYLAPLGEDAAPLLGGGTTDVLRKASK